MDRIEFVKFEEEAIKRKEKSLLQYKKEIKSKKDRIFDLRCRRDCARDKYWQYPEQFEEWLEKTATDRLILDNCQNVDNAVEKLETFTRKLAVRKKKLSELKNELIKEGIKKEIC